MQLNSPLDPLFVVAILEHKGTNLAFFGSVILGVNLDLDLLGLKLLLNTSGWSSTPEIDCRMIDVQGLSLPNSYLVSFHGQTRKSQIQE